MADVSPGWISFGGATGKYAPPPGATVSRPAGAAWERLVRGQRITLTISGSSRQWRVTEVDTYPDGSETYRLEAAELAAARIAADRDSPYRGEIVQDEPTRCSFW
jgi:hypothetical protein